MCLVFYTEVIIFVLWQPCKKGDMMVNQGVCTYQVLVLHRVVLPLSLVVWNYSPPSSEFLLQTYSSRISKSYLNDFQSCLAGLFLHLSWVVVAVLVACALFLSQIAVLSAVKTPAGQCLLGAFPSPAWNFSALAPTETWTPPAPPLLPLVSLWEAVLYLAHHEGVLPAAACLWAVHWPTGRHHLPSYVPAPPCPPQLLRVAAAMRAGLHSETVLPKRLLFFSEWIALGDMHRREQGMIQLSGSLRCGCQL